MKSPCPICLEDHEGKLPWHNRCLRSLFGAARMPSIDVEVSKLHTLALATVGQTTLSGIQRKISLGLLSGKTTLQLAAGRGRYILKPQSQTFPSLPENEHLTMRLASMVGIETPPCGIVRLPDGTFAYIVARFDRPVDGGKLHQEDFCQLARKSPKEKYEGSAELCARLVRTFATEPLIELVRLFRLLVFSWWTGNGDMHLKNFSLLTGKDGIHRLSPAYDLVSTRLVIPDDDLALPVGGKTRNLTRRSWIGLAEYCGIPDRVSSRLLQEFPAALERARPLVGRSFLPKAMQEAYVSLLEERAGILEP